MRKFAISDIHGCNITFNALLQKIGFNKSDELYLLGDYIDRGPNSKGVIDTILKLQKEGYFVKCLMGNHEDAMLKSRHDYKMLANWMHWGGVQTLQSFRTRIVHDVPRHYWDFLENLDLYLEVDDYILVHAGLNFDMPNPFDAEHSMIWIRNWYRDINYEWLNGRTIIHGHTPVPKAGIIENHKMIDYIGYLDIDAGCYAYDWLCAFEMTDKKLYFQERIDEVEL